MVVPPTMGQIAKRADVNRSTVSLALRNDPRLKTETRKRIQTLAAEMGYRKNPTVARLMTQLRAGQQKHFQSNIAILDFGPLGTVENQIWMGARQRAEMLGYGLEFFHVRDISSKRLEQILTNRGVHGIIINSLWGTTTLPSEFSNLWTKFSCCCIGVHPDSPELHFVGDDNYYTASLAVKKLAQLGFSHIGLALHRGINTATEYRFAGGYLTAHLADPALNELPILYLEATDQRVFLEWFRRVRPQAIICIQEEILTWLREADYSVPGDVSIVHLDLDVVTGSWAGTRQGRASRGKIAVDIVVSQINQNEVGIPTSQIAMLTESVWESGPTLTSPRQNGTCSKRSVPHTGKRQNAKSSLSQSRVIEATQF